ncbi:MAG: TetR/AcrR family transcriptional regulator C-terminal domain-containing protein [Eubacterium sp.]|nr:TetR/AcrR family transcriptional regulator C-terminal domain-containing protein [Eubacterium sp.]
MAEAALTKRAIANSLKELSEETAFDKISVGDISARCGINRQTFYYHFQDKYDLLTWIYYEDYFDPNLVDVSLENWDKCVCGLLSSLRKDKAFCVNTIKHAGEDMIRIFLADTEDLLSRALDFMIRQPEAAGRYLRSVDQEEQRFIARFFAYGVCGMVIEWVQTGMKEEPEIVSSRMRILLESCKQLAFHRVQNEREENEKNI